LGFISTSALLTPAELVAAHTEANAAAGLHGTGQAAAGQLTVVRCNQQAAMVITLTVSAVLQATAAAVKTTPTHQHRKYQ
jgi:hypothetical protein